MKVIATFNIPDEELAAKVPEFNENADEIGIDPFETPRDLADYLVEQIEEGNMDLTDLHDDYSVDVEYEVQES